MLPATTSAFSSRASERAMATPFCRVPLPRSPVTSKSEYSEWLKYATSAVEQ